MIVKQDFVVVSWSSDYTVLRMKLIDVYWTPELNRIVVLCNCGNVIDTWSNNSTVHCERCGRHELWHGVGPLSKGKVDWTSIGAIWEWSPVMEIDWNSIQRRQ